MKQSKQWQFNKADAKRVARNALIFLAPVAITLLTMAQQGVTDYQTYLYAFQIWVLGVVLDAFRKLEGGAKK
jgi:hypothetical protein